MMMEDELDLDAYIEYRKKFPIGKYDALHFGMKQYSLRTARDYKDSAIIHLLRLTGGDEVSSFRGFDPKRQKAKILWYGKRAIGFYVWSEVGKDIDDTYEPCLRQIYLLKEVRGTGLGKLMWWDFFFKTR